MARQLREFAGGRLAEDHLRPGRGTRRNQHRAGRRELQQVPDPKPDGIPLERIEFQRGGEGISRIVHAVPVRR